MTKSAFHELGMDRPDELVAKSRLITLSCREIRKYGASLQSSAGTILDLAPTQVSQSLMNENNQPILTREIDVLMRADSVLLFQSMSKGMAF